ncbi:MAG TPA: hypothetical protein IAD34_03460 [Candidatus Scatovicinus merdipullorum]|nr:hypothetical protein [Candidatus Scatovicinus merdipullorum]
MTLTEKISYIKGLAEGLKLDENKDEVKVIKAILELLEDMALSVTDLETCVDDVCDQLDAVDEDLADLEEDYYEESDCSCGGCDTDDDDQFYEVTCPTCGEEICLQEDVLLCGETECPKCGEKLEFDFSDLFAEDEDEKGCSCDCCAQPDHEEA